MTVNTTKITSGPYVGNNIVDTFSYGFRVVDKTQLKVYETDSNGVETLLTVDTDYTVNGVGNDAGGTIVRVSGPLPTGSTWYIRSDYKPTQLTAFESQGAFFPELHEDAMDKLTILIQQIFDRQDRAPRVSDSYSGSLPLSLPVPVAGDLLQWKGDLTGFDNVSFVDSALIATGQLVIYPNVAAMKADTSGVLVTGILALTQGYTNSGDGLGSFYLISGPASVDNVVNHTLQKSKVALSLQKEFNTVDEMKYTQLAQGTVVTTRGYYTAGDGGGSSYLISAPGTVDGYGDHLSTSGNTLLIKESKPDFLKYGVRADGITDDTAPFTAWVQANNSLIGIPGKQILIKDEVVKQVSQNTEVDLRGTILDVNPDSAQHIALSFDVTSSIDRLIIKGIDLKGRDKNRYGIYVYTNNSSFVTTLNIFDNNIEDLDNNSFITSVIGILTQISASDLSINRNKVFNLSRTQVDPGVIATVGISVDETNGSVHVKDNVVVNLTSPSGDEDCDAIAVFSENRNKVPSERQTIAPVISGNRLVNIKGRFFKLQCSNAKVHSNYCSNVGVEIINIFYCVDAQVGGVDIYDNTFRLGWSVGGSEAAIVGLQARATGDFENVFKVHDNTVIIENDLPVFAYMIPVANTDAAFEVYNNTVKSQENNKRVGVFAHITTPDTMRNLLIDIKNNNVPTGSGEFLYFSDAVNQIANAVKGPVIADYLRMRVRNNNNLLKHASSDIINSSSSGYPFIKDIVLSGNNGFTNDQINLQGFDILTAPEGNSFYYGTDGSGSGIVNAPSGYNRYMLVETDGINARLTSMGGDSFAIIRTDTGAGYTYSGTVIP